MPPATGTPSPQPPPLPPSRPAAATQTQAPPYGGPPPAGGPGGGRRLYRRSHDRVIAGVAGGIADYLGIEPWVVRIGFIILVPFGGFGALAYLIAWLLVPAAGSDQSMLGGVLARPSGFRTYLGVGLILLAVAILASAFSESGVIWAIALIAFGVFLFRQDPGPPEPPAPGSGPPAPPGAAAVPPSTTSTVPLDHPTDPLGAAPVEHPTDPLGVAPPGRPTDPGPPPALPPSDLPVWAPPPPPDRSAAWGAPAPRAPRRRPFLGPVTFAVALIVTALAIALDNLDVIDLSLGQTLAVFLTVLGGGLLVGTWWGRAWGLIPVGLLAVPVVAVAALAGPVPVEGGVAERLFQPQTPAAVRPSYRLAGGELIVDLSKVGFEAGQPPVSASVAGGRLLVVVPDEVAVRVRGRVGVGSMDLLGHVDTGAQVDSTVTEPALRPPAKGTAPTVDLDLMAGYGVIEVRRASDPRSFHEAGPFDDSVPQLTIPTTTTTAKGP
jgi:phage shock protein PspC (stress-responsive transcriptional regulator)